MKNRVLMISAAICGLAVSYASAQVMPPGASDKNLEDRNIKGRSIELERVSRESKNRNSKNGAAKTPELKFEEIKEDFERIQLAQNEIITRYTLGDKIDHKKISESAGEINQRSGRLMENLFADADKEAKAKEDDKAGSDEPENREPPSADLKTLIVELDNTLGEFVSNPMFTNPSVVKPEDNAKGRKDLKRISELSATLRKVANALAEQK